MTTAIFSPQPRTEEFLARPRLVRTLLGLGYLLLAWPVALALAVAVTVGLTVGAATLIIWVGLPLLLLTALITRIGADLERVAARFLVGVRIERPRYRTGQPGLTWLQRVRGLVADRQTYLEVLWLAVYTVASLVTWCVTVVWLAIGLGGFVTPFVDEADGFGTLFGVESRVSGAVISIAIGAAAMAFTPTLVAGVSRAQAELSRLLLGSQSAFDDYVARTERRREAAEVAEVAQLSRIERDLHDGPQQNLLALKLDLAVLQQQLQRTGGDPEQVAAVGLAMERSQAVLDEIRAVSRGAAPVVLHEHGLIAAARAAAAVSVVPTQLDSNLAELPGIFSPAVELAAYYVISESLANVGKHANATAAIVTITAATPGTLAVAVTDDGVGGAHPGKGHGLRGLFERVAAVDGTLAVHSPEGGPTVIHAEFPHAGR